MKQLQIAAIALVSGLLVVGGAHADEALAQSKGCLNCHNVQNKIIGPAFRDVAAKYKGQDVKKQLAEKVQKGGSGVWGSMPMPPNAVTPAEAETLVAWVLSLN